MKLKETLFNRLNLIIGIILLLSVVILNLSAIFYQNIVSFEDTVYISLIIIASTIASYLLFRLREDTNNTDVEKALPKSTKILHDLLTGLSNNKEPTDGQINSLLKSLGEVHVHERQEAYVFAIDIAQEADDELILLQQSPLLLFGARPFFDDPKVDYESKLFDILIESFNKSDEGEFEFYCAYSVDVSKKVVESILKDYPEQKQSLAKRLYTLCEFSRSNDIGFTFSSAKKEWTPGYHYISADDRFAIWFKDSGFDKQYVCFSSNHKGAANIFRRILKDSFEKTVDYDTASEELGLEGTVIEKRDAQHLQLKDQF